MVIAVIPGKPNVLGEGRVEKIDLRVDEADSIGMLGVDEEEDPVVLEFKDKEKKYYLNVYDHRAASRRTFLDGNGFIKAFQETPCLAGFRKKGQTLYCIVADIGTEDVRDGVTDGFVLSVVGRYDKRDYRVVGGSSGVPAIHPRTSICFLEPRPQ